MESFLKMDIFFFISSIAVVVITVISIIVGYYLIKIMKNFSHMSDVLRGTVDGAATSLEEVGNDIKESSVFRFFFGGKKKNKK